MTQNTSNSHSNFNDILTTYKQQIDNFNDNLKNDNTPTKLNVVQFERLLQEIENTPSALEEGTRKQFKARVITLKNDFTQKLLSTAQTLFKREAEGIIEEDAPIKAKRLLAMADQSLDSQIISPELRQNLREIARHLVQFIANHESKPTFNHSSDDIQSNIIRSPSALAKTICTSTPAHFSIVGFTGKTFVYLMSYLPPFSLWRSKTNPNSTPTPSPIGALPSEIIFCFMSFLGVKELGRLAQVSKAFFATANNEGLWEIQCRKQHEYVDITQLAANQNSYKLLYKNETDLSQFEKVPSQINFKMFTTNGCNRYNIPIDWKHLELKGKHVKHFIKEAALQNPSDYLGKIDADTPLSHIRIQCAGDEIKSEMLVKSFNVLAPEHLHLIIVAPSTLDYDNIAAVINQSSAPHAISKEMLESFDKRGGILKMWQEGKRIKLNKWHQFITGCSSRANSSQVARAFLLNKGCNVKAPLAGGESGANPLANAPIFSSLYSESNSHDQNNFRYACMHDKVPQLGADELASYDKDQAKHNQWFANFFSQLSDDHYHFICFGYSAASVIRRLLDKSGNLDKFTVTFMPWDDEVARPPIGIEPYSKEAYKAVYDKLERSFSFLD